MCNFKWQPPLIRQNNVVRTHTIKHVMLQSIRKVLWLGGYLTKKMDHIPMQHHNHTNPTIKYIQSLSSHDHFSHHGYYIVPTPRGVSSPAPLTLCPVDRIPRVGRTSISMTMIPLRAGSHYGQILRGEAFGPMRMQKCPKFILSAFTLEAKVQRTSPPKEPRWQYF